MHSVHDPLPPSEAFVPTMVWPGRRPSRGELASWYEALRHGIAEALPLDLMAFWLLPGRGGSVLVGPDGLAADRLELPAAEPLLPQEGLFALEDRILASGYRSVMAVPIRSEVQDVGVLLVAAFAPDSYTLAGQRRLLRIAAELAPACRRLAGQPWASPAPRAEERTEMVAGTTEALLDAMDGARNGADLALLLSDALSLQLPHDRLELIAVAPAPDCWALTSIDGLPGRRLPLDPVDLDRIDALVHRAGSADCCLIGDIGGAALEWPGPIDRTTAGRISSLALARMEVGGEVVGWLAAGSESPDWFDNGDAAVLRHAARVVAPRVAAWSARHELAGAWG